MTNNILVTQPSMPPLNEYLELIQDIWDTHWLTTMGKYHKEFQLKLKDYFDADNIELFTNGHMALELSIQAMNFSGKGGMEVITTPFTFASTTHAIFRNGLMPVFCDINPVNYTIDVTKIEALITDRTCAILPVHVYGNVCNIEEIERIAKKYGLKVIYDAAHAFGVRYKGLSTANFGDVSIFSFHATKVFNTIEGGAACFRDKEIGKKLYNLKNFGINGPESVIDIGANAKMNEFCAAMGLCNLRHIDDEIRKRKAVYDRYIENLSDVEGLKLNMFSDDITPNYAYFPVVFDEKLFGASRNEVFESLARNQIHVRKYFYPLTNSFECFHGMFDVSQTPIDLYLSNRILTLPLYSELSLEDVDKICRIILSCKKQ